jgi:hypothetical protein
MPLYQVVVRAGEREEVRITDRKYEVGETVEIANRMWVVVAARAATEQEPARFVVEPITPAVPTNGH